MQLSRYVGIVDVGIAVMVLVAIVLPPREMFARSLLKQGSEADHFTLALAEARTIASPDDGPQIAELARRLGEARFKDWAIEASVDGSERAKQSPTRWRALLAASVAYVDRLDVVPGLDYANRALASCEAAREAGHGSCPSWEEIRMRLYHQHLDAGVKSGIDPRYDPMGFRRAGEGALRTIRLTPMTQERGPDKVPPAPGSAAP